MAALSHHRVAILATDGFEELELTEPLRALRMAGARVDVIAPKEGPVQAFHHDHETIRVHVDRVLCDTVIADQYDALVLPGGRRNSAALRKDPAALKFVCDMSKSEKPIAAICHAGWVLAAAGMAEGRRLTSYPGIQQDMHEAGAEWINAEVVVDDNLVTSRAPSDLPAFNREMIELFSQSPALISPNTRHLFARSRIV